MEGNGTERKERAVNGREWNGKEGKGSEWKVREWKGRAVNGRERNGKEGKGLNPYFLAKQNICFCVVQCLI